MSSSIPNFPLDLETCTRVSSEIQIHQAPDKQYIYTTIAKLTPFKEVAINPTAPESERRYRRSDTITFSSLCKEHGISWGKERIGGLGQLREKISQWLAAPEMQTVCSYTSWDDAESWLTNFPPDFDQTVLPLIVLDAIGQFDGVLLSTHKENHMVYISGSALYTTEPVDAPKNIHSLDVALISKRRGTRTVETV